MLRKVNDPYPYLRGLVAEFEDEIDVIQFEQPKRQRGKTKNSFSTHFDYGMLGLVKHSYVPIRLVTFLGFIFSLLSVFSGLVYFFYKLIYWESFEMRIGPIIIGMFFFFSIIVFLIGLIGEYILSILSYSRNLPLVVEKERINFE